MSTDFRHNSRLSTKHTNARQAGVQLQASDDCTICCGISHNLRDPFLFANTAFIDIVVQPGFKEFTAFECDTNSVKKIIAFVKGVPEEIFRQKYETFLRNLTQDAFWKSWKERSQHTLKLDNKCDVQLYLSSVCLF